jgi:glycosyltransferase involved in cell wall biosynthesis
MGVKILFLIPQPFYSIRGTPIDEDLFLRVLSERGDQIDVVTYHLGEDVHYENVTIHRSASVPLIREVQPGFSFKKVICDLFLLIKALSLVRRNQYHLIHAVEEGVFIALLIKVLFKIPYIYDMDSSLPQQMVEKYPFLIPPVTTFLEYSEKVAVRHAKCVIPVCDALKEGIEKYGPRKIKVIHDVNLLERNQRPVNEDVRLTLGIDGPLLMYVGNLEKYQGIDLLLEGFCLALRDVEAASLVIIGGIEADIQFYKEKSARLGIASKVHFLGIRPIDNLKGYLVQADILVSPRIKGVNTPMKIYSFLASGRPLLATNLQTHTQVLDNRVALLADPDPEAYAAGMIKLLEDESLRQRLGRQGQRMIEERHSITIHRNNVIDVYGELTKALVTGVDPRFTSTDQ